MKRKVMLGAASAVLTVSILFPTAAFADIGGNNGSGQILYAMPDNNEEGARGFVARIYTIALGREYDEDGLQYWCGLLEGQQTTGLDIFIRITDCPEFKDKGLNNEEYLKVLYGVFFDREPDTDGYYYWYYSLEEGMYSRDEVLVNFAYSEEWQGICKKFGILPGVTPPTTDTVQNQDAIQGFVERLYSGCLGRQSDQDGLDYWSNQLRNGQLTGKQTAYNFFTSPEFADIAKNLSDSELVERFYQVFLDRASEADGAEYWKKSIEGKDNKIAILFNGFSGSREFEDICKNSGIVPGDAVGIRVRNTDYDEAYKSFRSRYLEEGIATLSTASLSPKTSYKFCNVQGSERVWETRSIPEADLRAIEEFAATYFDPMWTAGEKAAFSLFWIHNNMSYGGGTDNYAVSALVNRSGQCAQYNGAMVEIMCWLGFDACLIQGARGRSAPGAQHFWGEVYIGDSTYVIEAGNTKDGNWNYFALPYSRTRKFIVCGQVMG